MNIFYPTHKLLLKKLIETGVDFILVGGYAVNYHGYNRVTGDMDIWIRPDNENKTVLLSALKELDFDENGLLVLNGWNFSTPRHFHIGNQPDLTDFMTFISGVTYREAKQSVLLAKIDGITLPIIHLNHLIQNKIASGRSKDMVDVEYLNKVFNLKKK